MSIGGLPIRVGCYRRRVMYTNKLILKAEVYAVVNAALEVLKELGHGFHEKPYENVWPLSSIYAEYLASNKSVLT